MAQFSNNLMVEFMVPRDPETERRVRGFYQEIGWPTWANPNEPEFIYTRPLNWGLRAPTIGYWLTENSRKIDHFEQNPDPDPSAFSVGFRLPFMNDLVEVCLVLPGLGDFVSGIYENGGELLQKHCHMPLRENAGSTEFRFTDPFNYSLRVTTDPGYKV